MDIKLGIIGKIGLLNYLQTEKNYDIIEIRKFTVIEKRKVISVSFTYANGNRGSTFVGLKKFQVAELKRMVGRSKEVTNEDLIKYHTDVHNGTCRCASHQHNHYQVNGVTICKHMVAYAKKCTLINNLKDLSEYIKTRKENRIYA